jgi:hypothetical protein
VNENQSEAPMGMAYQSRNPTIQGMTNHSPARPRRLARADLREREGAVGYSTAPSLVVDAAPKG